MTLKKWIKYTFYFIIVLSPVMILAQWKVYSDPIRRSVEASLANDKQLYRKVGAVQEVKLKRSTYVQPGILHSGERTEGYNIYDFVIEGQLASALIRVQVAETEFTKTDGVEYRVEYRE